MLLEYAWHKYGFLTVMNYNLTETELSIWKNIAAGMTSMEIASKLNLPVNRVNTNLKRIYKKLNVRSKAEAAIKFIKEVEKQN